MQIRSYMKRKKLTILYEDKYLIIINKPANLLMISKNDGTGANLYSEVREYVKRQNPHNKIFIVHRLDRETRGLVIFAKSEKVKYALQSNWDKVIRKYYAIVVGNVKNKKARLEHYLKESKSLQVYVSKTGKKAITDYEVIKASNKYSLLNIEIKTGRKNQIRVQLSHINYPILGDSKYGEKFGNFLFLQAYYLSFEHPITKKNIEIKLDIDNNFAKVMK